MMVEADCIVPAPGGSLRRDGFDVVVFCAEEFQPPSSMYPGVLAIHAPNDDSNRAPTMREIETARKASRLVAAYVAEGRKVLVTCMAGRNRSGLVTAMAICRLYGVSGRDAMWHVKRKRRSILGEALTNPQFEALLEGYHANAPRTGWLHAGAASLMASR